MCEDVQRKCEDEDFLNNFYCEVGECDDISNEGNGFVDG